MAVIGIILLCRAPQDAPRYVVSIGGFCLGWEDNKEEIREAYEHFLFYGEWPENFLQADKL